MKLLDLFTKAETKDRDVFYCCNPECQTPIHGDRIPYDRQTQEVYCNPFCHERASDIKAVRSGEIFISDGDVHPTTRKKANKLYKSGKLKQPA